MLGWLREPGPLKRDVVWKVEAVFLPIEPIKRKEKDIRIDQSTHPSRNKTRRITIEKEAQSGGINKKKEGDKKDPINKRKSNGEKKSF